MIRAFFTILVSSITYDSFGREKDANSIKQEVCVYIDNGQEKDVDGILFLGKRNILGCHSSRVRSVDLMFFLLLQVREAIKLQLRLHV